MADDDLIKEICNDQEIIKNLTKKQNEQRKIGKYCDYIIKTEDGGTFSTHKSVLESVSSFFDKLLNIEFNEKEKECVLLKNCSSYVMEKIIEFMYIGNVEITSDIAKETLDISLFLGLNTLVDTCTKILIQTINNDNCFELLSYSETYYRGENLAKKSIKIICENFEEFFEKSNYLIEISIDSMKLLCEQYQNNNKDEKLFLLIVNWITYNMNEREKYITELLEKINFENMSYEFRLNRILKNNPLFDKKGFMEKIVQILSKDWNEKYQKIQQLNEIKNLYTVIGNEIILYDSEMMKFSKIITKICNNTNHFGYTTFGDKNIFICGGKINNIQTKECHYYSMNENCWKKLPSMENPRQGHRALNLNNKIYCCGGGDNEKTVEIFDINKMEWYKGPSLDYSLGYGIGLCSLKTITKHDSNNEESIYAIAKNNLLSLDIRTDKWFKLQNPPGDEAIYSAISYNNKIYAFGYEKIKTYDVSGGKWSENILTYEKCYTNSNCPLACMINNKIYVFAKLNCERFVLNLFDPMDLSNCSYQIMKLPKNDLCWALFSA